MELEQLRCFVAVAEELHFGRAAQRIGLLPASLGRHVKLLEASLRTPLLSRTTRNVALTEDGVVLLEEIRPILTRLEELEQRFRAERHRPSSVLRIGAIDSAAAGLIPQILHDLKAERPELIVHLVEDKSIRLVPKLLAGGLDLVFIRPREGLSRNINVKTLLEESAVVALPENHPLASRADITVRDLVDEPLIVPERRSRPHSHDLTFEIFSDVGLRPRIAQMADEKQTIINLVAAGIGCAVVPRWTSKLTISGVRYVTLKSSDGPPLKTLPLAVAWMKAVRDQDRDAVLELLDRKLKQYSAL
ncbi:LysR family transcriptional regulator [Agrobacterium sp. 22-221-1]|uniref:LysR family transcriptional regulator n=1 Tax=Agrobacterium leguminum TaxID=2792015 RepID=UPI003CE57750